MADNLHSIGSLLFETGKPTEALESYRKSLTIRQELSAANPSILLYQSSLAACLITIGTLKSDLGMLDEAAEFYAQGLARFEKTRGGAQSIDTGATANLSGIALSDMSALTLRIGKPLEAGVHRAQRSGRDSRTTGSRGTRYFGR